MSSDFPTSENAYDSSINGNIAVFISRFSSTTKEMIFSTFFAGSDGGSHGFPHISSNNVINIAFETVTPDLPVVGVDSKPYNSGWDVYYGMFSHDGSRLLYSTYIGGPDDDGIADMESRGNNTYLLMVSESSNISYPINGYSTSNPGRSASSLIVMFNTDSKDFIGGTFIGGSSDDIAYDLKVSQNNSLIIAGETYSSDYPVNMNSFPQGNRPSGFVTIVSPDLDEVQLSFLIGGAGCDVIKLVTHDSKGDLIISGHTYSHDFPITEGVFGLNNTPGDIDNFLTKISPDGSRMIFSTLLGGTVTGADIGLDSNDNIIIIGDTSGSSFPTTYGCPFPDPIGSGDIFIMKISHDCDSLIYSSYFGGSGNENPIGMDYLQNGNILFAGITTNDYPVSDDAFRKNRAGLQDGFFTEFNFSIPPHPPSFFSYNIGNRFVNMSWEPPGENGGWPVLGYNVYRGDEMEHMELVMSTTADITYFNDTNIENGREYYYSVTAVNVVGESQTLGPILVLDKEPPLIRSISYPNHAKNNEDILISTEICDNVGIISAEFHYWFDDGIMINETMQRREESTFAISIFIPSDETGELNFLLSVVDFTGNVRNSTMISIPIMDTIPPVIVSDNTPTKGITGQPITFSFIPFDNIEIAKVNVIYWYETDSVFNRSMSVSGISYYLNETLIHTLVPLKYRYIIIDTSGNIFISEIREIEIIDNIEPKIVLDMSGTSTFTGEDFTFKAQFQDNVRIESVRVEYWYGDGDHLFLEMDPGESYSATLTIPNDSILPLRYRFICKDTSGNSLITGATTVKIIDSIPPIVTDIVWMDPPENGNRSRLSITASDNILVDSVIVEYWFDEDPEHSIDNMIPKERGWIWEPDIPLDSCFLNYNLIINDGSNNSIEYNSYKIPVIDRVLPNVDPVEDQYFRIGEWILIPINVSDNRGSLTVTVISDMDLEFDNGSIQGWSTSQGEHEVIILVTDGSNNSFERKFRIHIVDEENEQHLDTPIIFITIGCTAVILISGCIILLSIKRKKKPVKYDENTITDPDLK